MARTFTLYMQCQGKNTKLYVSPPLHLRNLGCATKGWPWFFIRSRECGGEWPCPSTLPLPSAKNRSHICTTDFYPGAGVCVSLNCLVVNQRISRPGGGNLGEPQKWGLQPIVLCYESTTSGGSKGGRQGRAPPPPGQNVFIFMHFLEKIRQIVGWRPPPL